LRGPGSTGPRGNQGDSEEKNDLYLLNRQTENVEEYLRTVTELCDTIIDQGACCVCMEFFTTKEMGECSTCTTRTCYGCINKASNKSANGDLEKTRCPACRSTNFKEKTMTDIQKLRDKITALERKRDTNLQSRQECIRDIDMRANRGDINVVDKLIDHSIAELRSIGQESNDIEEIIYNLKKLVRYKKHRDEVDSTDMVRFGDEAQRLREEAVTLRNDSRRYRMPPEFTEDYFTPFFISNADFHSKK